MDREWTARGYRIAGIRIRVEGPADGFYEREQMLEGYCDTLTGWDHRICLRRMIRLPEPAGGCIHRAEDRLVFRDGSRSIQYLGPAGLGPELADVRLCREGTETELCFRKGETGRIRARELLNAMDLPHILTVHGGFLLHASFVEHEGKAILFTAPSETGKSTQADLWCDHEAAELVNGDRAAVRLIDGEVCACGIPFSGSSPVRRNVTLPLKAIVYLSQAPENSITKLRGVRAFRSIWEGCTVNIWDRADVEKATKTVTEVITRVPVYHLACTPDVRAVELLKQTMEVEK